jgi:hypothetical protein
VGIFRNGPRLPQKRVNRGYLSLSLHILNRKSKIRKPQLNCPRLAEGAQRGYPAFSLSADRLKTDRLKSVLLTFTAETPLILPEKSSVPEIEIGSFETLIP